MEAINSEKDRKIKWKIIIISFWFIFQKHVSNRYFFFIKHMKICILKYPQVLDNVFWAEVLHTHFSFTDHMHKKLRNLLPLDQKIRKLFQIYTSFVFNKHHFIYTKVKELIQRILSDHLN